MDEYKAPWLVNEPYRRGPGVCRQCMIWKISIYSDGLCESCAAAAKYDKQQEEMRMKNNIKDIDTKKFFRITDNKKDNL